MRQKDKYSFAHKPHTRSYGSDYTNLTLWLFSPFILLTYCWDRVGREREREKSKNSVDSCLASWLSLQHSLSSLTPRKKTYRPEIGCSFNLASILRLIELQTVIKYSLSPSLPTFYLLSLCESQRPIAAIQSQSSSHHLSLIGLCSKLHARFQRI